MRVTSRLLQQQCRITFFTRKHCGLCIAARSVLSDVWDARPFAFKEVDIVKPESQDWKDLYDFDVPVVSFPQLFEHLLCPVPNTSFAFPFQNAKKTHNQKIHISKASAPEEDPKLVSQALKLMHRFTPEQVKAKMDEAEKA